MTKMNICLNRFLAVTVAVICSNCFAVSSPQLVAPPYKVTNRHDVNVTTGQVQMTHTDVKIGSLSHSISMHNSSWAGPDADPSGPTDQYSGRLICVRRNAYTGDTRFWLIASDGASSQFFDPGTGSAAVPDASGNFPALTDKRFTLRYELAENGMVMTKPDGTKIIYGASAVYTNMDTCSPYDMTEIRKPDGFSIKINLYTNGKPGSVTTNTGFQLRSYFVPRSATVDPVAWWGLNPAYVVGINNAVQYCPNTAGSQLDSDCATSSWPKAQYIWPDNMPTTMLNGNGTFSVINPDGVRTDYYQQAYINNPSHATRLVGIKRSGSSDYLRQYIYTPYVIKSGYAFYWANELGVLSGSSSGSDSITYSNNQTAQGLYTGSTGYQTILSAYTKPSSDSTGGRLVSVSSWDYSVSLNDNGQLQAYGDKTQGIDTTYGYDARGNINSVTSRGVTQSALYEDTCTTANYKYCNSPKWVSDFKGNKTYYTYHPDSGQLATVTSPVNKQGVAAVVRYGYEKKYAKYYVNNSVAQATAPTGIWLKTTEKTCTNTATVADTCTGGAVDEIVSRFEYNSDNLFLTGMTVTAADSTGTIVTQRTCYQYDKYGNRIGETQPKANLASCN